MIVETKTPYKPIDLTHAKPEYAQAKTDILPKNFFVMTACGARNSGKTFAVCQLIRQMESHGVFKGKTKIPIRTILISPTAHMNPVFETLTSLKPEDIYLEYTDDLIHDIQDDIHETKAKAEQYQEDLQLYKKMLKMRRLDDLTMEDLFSLNQRNFEPPEPPEYEHPPITNLILDDLIGTSAFRNGRSPLTNLLLRNRHHQLNIIICSQTLKQIPKSVRTNTNVFMLFPFANASLLTNDFYEEVSNIIKEEDLVKLFEYATKEPHSFMMVDFTKPKDKTFRKGLDTFLTMKS